MQSFKRALTIQIRVIWALMLRDIVAQCADKSIPFMPLLRQPIMMITIFYALGRAVQEFAPSGFPLLVFIITGYLTWMGFLRCFSAIELQNRGDLLMFPHVTPLDLMLAQVATEFFLSTVMFVLLCALGMLFEQAPLPSDPLGVLLAFWSAIALGLAMGMMAASLGRFTTILQDLWRFLRRVGHVLSGVFALATDTPQSLVNILRWNPLFHSIEWLRQSWWGAYKSPVADPNYILTCLFFMVAIGLAFERASRRWQQA